MSFDEVWLRLLAGVTFSQPIKKNVVKKWRFPSCILLSNFIVLCGVHYWAQNAIGPLLLAPLAFALFLSLIEPTTRLLTTIFYLSGISLLTFVFFVLYMIILTEGHIVAAGIPSIVVLSLYCVDCFISCFSLFLSNQILNEHDMPEVSGGLLESVVSFPGDENDDDTETQPLWKSFEGKSCKVEEINKLQEHIAT